MKNQNRSVEDLRQIFLEKDENEDFHSMSGFNSEEVYAGGEASSQTIQSGPPLIITLTNDTGSAITNVVFLDVIESIKNGATNNGVTTGVTATFDHPNMDYAGFLQYLQGVPHEIVQITTVSDTASNLRQSYKIYTYNYSGKDFSDTVFPIKNTFQQATDQFDTNIEFVLQATTRFTLTSLAASSAITFYLYPGKIGSSIAALGNGRTFAKPMHSGTPIMATQQTRRI